MNDTITDRQNEEKTLFLEMIKKTPIIQLACEKSGISRSTFYRWCNQDSEFKTQSNQAIKEGLLIMNDYVESKLLNLIKENHPNAIFYWLNNRHPDYSPKILLSEEELRQLITVLFNPDIDKSSYETVITKIFQNKFSNAILKLLNTFLHDKRIDERLKIDDRKRQMVLMALSRKKI
jgi:hypothetical protein